MIAKLSLFSSGFGCLGKINGNFRTRFRFFFLFFISFKGGAISYAAGIQIKKRQSGQCEACWN